MPGRHYKEKSFAQTYHALVSREDYQGNLLGAIQAITPISDLNILELGAGTGRVSRLIAPFANNIVATDLSYPMLKLAKEFLKDLDPPNWQFIMADHHALSLKKNSVDLVISGWSFHRVAAESDKNWKIAVNTALSHIAQILRPGGTILLIESLGTGYEQPHPPEDVADYLAYLDRIGFNSRWIRTDYCFQSIQEARALTSFFWGDVAFPFWETEEGVILPECTGLWWKTLE
jgi:ubiquinone/menaquinone biosynthesis C-methylase UbiE